MSFSVSGPGAIVPVKSLAWWISVCDFDPGSFQIVQLSSCVRPVNNL